MVRIDKILRLWLKESSPKTEVQTIFKNTQKIKSSLVEIQVFIDPFSPYSISIGHNGLRDKNLCPTVLQSYSALHVYHIIYHEYCNTDA